MNTKKIFKKVIATILLVFALNFVMPFAFNNNTVYASTVSDYWENQKVITHMVYGPFIYDRTGNELNKWYAKIPGTFDKQARNMVLSKYGSIDDNKTYKIRWYQKLTSGKYGGTDNGSVVGLECIN